jgi:uncharacterized protein with PIN domain
VVVRFRFYGQLNDFLPRERRALRFAYFLRHTASVKDTIEALGVPHPEVDLIVVNGDAASFDRRLADGDSLSVFPRFRSIDIAALRVGIDPPRPVRFVADAHLGKLAAYLRLAGFDTRLVHDDAEIAGVSATENRVALTRDVALLKRGTIRYGRWVRHVHPEAQLHEVVDQFELADDMRPFTRCLVCNGESVPVDPDAVADAVPPLVRASFDDFCRCAECGRVYWRGTHYDELLRVVDGLRVRSA